MNLDSCAVAIYNLQLGVQAIVNQQVAVATKKATKYWSSFISFDGPVREARL